MRTYADQGRAEVWRVLEARGIEKVIVSFSGGNDEGGADEIAFFRSDGERERAVEMPYIRLANKWTGSEFPEGTPLVAIDGDWQKPTYREATEQERLEHDLREQLEKPVYDKYSTFAGEFHVDGEVVWNVAERRVTMTANESIDHYDHIEEEV